MPGSGTSVFTDPDDYQASLRWAQMELLVTFRDFKARLTWAELHCVRLLRSHEDLPRIAYVSLEPALVFVTFPTTVDPPPVWSGVDVQSGNIHVPQPRRAAAPADARALSVEPDSAASEGPPGLWPGAIGKASSCTICRPGFATSAARHFTTAAFACTGMPACRDKTQDLVASRGRARR